MKSLPLGLLYCHCHDQPVPRQATNWSSLQLKRNGIHQPMDGGFLHTVKVESMEGEEGPVYRRPPTVVGGAEGD